MSPSYIILGSLLILAIGWSQGAVISWTNPKSGAWNDTNNWNTSTVPTAKDVVYIFFDKNTTMIANSSILSFNISLGNNPITIAELFLGVLNTNASTSG